MIAWLAQRWKGVGIAIAALVLAARLLWSRWKDKRAIAEQTGRADRATAERDAEAARAELAETRVAVAADHADEIEAASEAEEGMRDVPRTDDPAADRAALYERARVLLTDDDDRP